MALNTIFRDQGGEKLATYDFYDLAEGTGIVKFYGYCVDTGTGTKAYRLTTNSSMFSTSGATSDNNYGKTQWNVAGGASGNQEVNFDITFNKPQNIKGKVQLVVQTSLHNVNPNGTMYIKATLYKYDGSTETAISSQITSETINQTTGGTPFFVLEIPLTALTHFKKGETLRVEVIMYYALSASSTYFILYHSPCGQTAKTDQTDKFILNVPFVIE
jgi:hypothetical protein